MARGNFAVELMNKFKRPGMIYSICMGQWIGSIAQLLRHATDGDQFLLPSKIHMHAFQEASAIVNKNLDVSVSFQESV